jgi:hypothetical protein
VAARRAVLAAGLEAAALRREGEAAAAAERLRGAADLRTEHDRLALRAATATADAARAADRIEAEQDRAASFADCERRLDLLRQYRGVIQANGGIADALLRLARRDLEWAINDALTEIGASFSACLSEDFTLLHRARGPPGENGLSSANDDAWVESSLASGYQRFAISLAARLALWRLAEVPLPDCLIVDEGFGACDEGHLDGLAESLAALATVKGGPALVFVVSHVAALAAQIERPLVLTAGPDGSRVANAPLEAALGGLLAGTVGRDGAVALVPEGYRLPSAEERGGTKAPHVICVACAAAVAVADTAEHTRGHRAAATATLAPGAAPGTFTCTACCVAVRAAGVDKHLATKKHRAALSRIRNA